MYHFRVPERGFRVTLYFNRITNKIYTQWTPIEFVIVLITQYHTKRE